MKIKLPVLVGLLAGVVALITFCLTQFHAAIEISMNSAWGELNDKPHVARITLHNTGHLAVYDCRVDYYVGPKTERKLSVSDYREYESKADKGTQTVPSLEPAHSMVWDFPFTPKVKPYFGLASATCRYETLLDRANYVRSISQE